MTADSHPESAAKQTFERLAEPLRREIKVHCYRMMGSLHEADDLVQETYLRAWSSFDRFEPGGSFRAWLYRIATNACLNALESRKSAQRLLPDQLGPASSVLSLGAAATEVPWLEPYPDSDLAGVVDDAPGPEARYAASEAVQLAFVAVIQQLPPRQRAALLLCDVLGWAATEAAALLGGSTASINSALQRGREALARRYPEGRAAVSARRDRVHQELLDRYVKAWEGHDLDGFVALLKEDATLAMPPWPQWYIGRDDIRSLLATVWLTCSGLRMVPTAANHQPAFAVYESTANGSWTAHSIHVLELGQGMISALTLFVEPRLFKAFELAPTLAEAPGA
jgi:RNA polymerase sigma-70 factor (ECF subfamily)